MNVSIASLDSEAWRLFDSLLTKETASTQLPLGSVNFVPPRLAVLLGLDPNNHADPWPTISIGDQRVRIGGVLTARQSAMLRMAGIGADLYLTIPPTAAWLRADIRPYYAVALQTAATAGVSLDSALVESFTVFPFKSSREDGFVETLAITIGPWRSAGAIVVSTLGLLAAMICAALWTSYRDQQLAMQRELATRRALGASLGSLAILSLRQSLFPAVVGILTSAILTQASASLNLNSWISLPDEAIPFDVELGMTAWLKGAMILLPVVVIKALF